MKNRATVALSWDPASLRAMDAEVQNAFKAASEQLGDSGKKTAKLLAAAVAAGAKSTQDNFTKLINDHTAKLTEAQKKVNALQEEQTKADAEFIAKVKDKNLTKAQKDALLEQKKAADSLLAEKIKKEKRATEDLQVKAIRSFERSSAKEIRVAEEHAKILTAAHESAAKLSREMFQEGGELFASAVSNGLNLSIDSFRDGLVNGISLAATKIPQMAAKANERRADKGAPSAILNVLTKIGPVLLGVTAVLGGLAAIFTAVMNQTLEYNKAILDGASALDIFGASALDAGFNMRGSLKIIREAALDVALVTGQTAENVIQAIMAYNNSGVSLKTLQGQFSKTGDAMEAYTEMAYFASTYTKTLGVSVDELTGQYGDLFTKAGMGLEGIKDSFQAIATAAMASGMNVKDFFTTVSQTTSGLALYNLRLEDTSKQLLGLTKILGKEKAKEMVGAEGQLGGAGYDEKFRSGMLVKKRGEKIFKGSFDRQSQSFEKDARAALGDSYDNILGGLMSDSKRLADMSGEELGRLEQKIAKAGGVQGDALARRLRNVRQVAIGAQGGAANMATGMGGLGPMEDLAMRIQKGMSLIGEQSLDAMRDLPSRKFFEEQSGISGRQFDELSAIMNRIKSQPGAEGMTDAEAFTRLAKGEIPLSEEDRKTLEDMKPPESMEKLLQKQVNETTSVNDTLKNLIAGLLESLSEIVSSILDGLVSWMPDSFGAAKKARMELLDTKERIRGRKEDIKTKEEQLREYKGKVALLPEGPGKDLALEQIEALQQNIDVEKARLAFDEKIEKENKAGKSGTAAQVGATGVSTLTKKLRKAPTIGGRQSDNEPYEALVPKTQEQLLAETEAAKEAQIKADADRSAAERKSQKTDDDTKKILENIEENSEKASAIEMLSSAIGDPALIARARMGDTEALTGLQAYINANPEAAGFAAKAGIAFQDFIYRGDGTRGTINPINKKDEFFGAKPGGAIDKAINGGGGGVVNINIYGGDENKVYQVVKRVLQESGIRGGR